jgi:hypothetical protein
MCQRHLDKLDASIVEQWVLDAARIDALAGMVLLDAIDFFLECLRFLNEERHSYLIGPRFKRDFTQVIQGIQFVFRVPVGGELRLFDAVYGEGNYGVGNLIRCHLSQATTHINWGSGDFVFREDGTYDDRGYFDVSCEIACCLKRQLIPREDEAWGVRRITATIPLRWIHEIEHWDEDGKVDLKPASDQNEILRIADQAIVSVQQRHANRMRLQSDAMEVDGQ